MLTAAIASHDPNTAAQLQASLEQTGLIGSIKQWIIPGERIDASEGIPDVILLDLGPDPEPCFVFGAHLRRLRPAVKLIACSAANPPGQQLLLDAMRSGVQDFVTKPTAPEVLRDLFARFHEEGPASEQKAANKLIVLMGAKGGSGTTTVAVNLGVQLCTFARKRTVLLDLARPLGNAHLLLDLNPRFGIRDAIENINRLDSHFFEGLLTTHKTKLQILGGVLHPEEWQSITGSLLDRVANVAQANSEVVLADVGSQLGPDWAPIFKASRMIMVVAETNVPALWTLERRLSALQDLGIDSEKVRVVVNRWHKADQETLTSIEKNIKRPIFAFLPNDFKKASFSVNSGTPLMDNHNNNLNDHFRKLASLLAGMDVIPVAKRNGIGNFLFPTKR